MTKSLWQRYWPYFSPVAILAILIAAGTYVVATLPPRTIVMATGPEGGSNYELGARYREVLAKSGVDLKLLPTSGSLENLRLLRDAKSGVSVGLVQDGLVDGAETSGVESLGAVGYEPLWLFHRAGISRTLTALAGKRVSIGPEGSGGRAFALNVLKRTKTAGTIGELLGFPAQVAAEKLIAGDIDAAFIVTGWDLPAVQSLINARDVELTSFDRADAMVALYPFLTKLTLPRGIFDLANDRPPADIQLLASKSILAVRADLHSALQYLLLTAATEIHSRSGLFQKAEQFPVAEFGRPAAQRRRRALPPVGPAVPAGTAAVLVRGAHRQGAVRSGASRRCGLPDIQGSSPALRLDDALEDSPSLRRDAVGGGYDGA